MKYTGSVKRNVIYQTTYEIFSMLIPFVLSPYISRVIGAEGVGIYSYRYSIAFYFTLVAALGIKNYGNRTIAKCCNDREDLNRSFSNLITIQFIMSVLCVFSYVAYSLFFVDIAERIYAVLMIIQVVSSIFDISWFYFGIENFRMTVAVNGFIKVLNLSAVFTFVRSRDDLGVYCFIMSLSILAGQVILWFPLKKYVSYVRPKASEMRMHIRPLFVLFIPTVAVSLYKYMDKIMIGMLSSKTQLGFYENAEKVVLLPLTIIASFGTVMIPRMSGMVARNDTKTSIRYTKTSALYVMGLAYALSFGFIAVAGIFAPVYWGMEFELSGDIIIGLSVTIPFIAFANIIRTQYLIPNEKDKEYVISVVGGAISNLLLNYMLIPYMGSIGATIATVVAEIVVCAIQCMSVRQELPLWDMFVSSLPFLGFGFIMCAVVYWLGNLLTMSVASLLIMIMTGVAIYGTESGVFLYMTKEPVFMTLVRNIANMVRGRNE